MLDTAFKKQHRNENHALSYTAADMQLLREFFKIIAANSFNENYKWCICLTRSTLSRPHHCLPSS